MLAKAPPDIRTEVLQRTYTSEYYEAWIALSKWFIPTYCIDSSKLKNIQKRLLMLFTLKDICDKFTSSNNFIYKLKNVIEDYNNLYVGINFRSVEPIDKYNLEILGYYPYYEIDDDQFRFELYSTKRINISSKGTLKDIDTLFRDKNCPDGDKPQLQTLLRLMKKIFEEYL